MQGREGLVEKVGNNLSEEDRGELRKIAAEVVADQSKLAQKSSE